MIKGKDKEINGKFIPFPWLKRWVIELLKSLIDLF